MTARTSAISAVSAALAMAFLGAGNPVQAQVGVDRVTRTEGITVVAPRILLREGLRADEQRGRVEIAQESAFVDFSDLDLTRTGDLYRLEQRIVDAAHRVCNDLADLYPRGNPETPTCIDRAIDDAMALAQDVARDRAAFAAADDR